MKIKETLNVNIDGSPILICSIKEQMPSIVATF